MIAHARILAVAHALALVALAACSRAPATDRGSITDRAATVPTPIDAAAPAADADRDCVEACVQGRRMEATSMDYIRASCARECAALPPPTP